MREPRSFDRVAASYDATRGGSERGRQYASDIAPLLAGRGTALEIGIGTGVVAKALADLHQPVLGVDIAPFMLAHAVRRIGPRVAVANAEHLPMRDGSVEGAYAVWVLHVVDAAAVLREVARVLRPGGRFVICPSVAPEPDPITDTLQPMYQALHGTKGRGDDPGTLMLQAIASGFRDVERRLGATHHFSSSPATEAAQLEARSSSALWDLDDDRWERFVVPTIDALRALPDSDRDVERAVRPPILVLDR